MFLCAYYLLKLITRDAVMCFLINLLTVFEYELTALAYVDEIVIIEEFILTRNRAY